MKKLTKKLFSAKAKLFPHFPIYCFQKIFIVFVILITINISKSHGKIIQVSENISTDTEWKNSNIYELIGNIYVINGATLTIQAGTIIKSDCGALVITTGSTINAEGSACAPIVFTSSKEEGQRGKGDWKGLFVCGYAEVNWPGDTGRMVLYPCDIQGDTMDLIYNTFGGGTRTDCINIDCPDNNDNSGILKYVRIEYSETGLTLGGVGSGTTIDHIQVTSSGKDSYTFLGGSVNCKHLIAYDGQDDDFDISNGYSGKVQFGLAMRNPAVADVSGSKAFESDNDSTGSAATPQTSCIFQNMTCLGGSSITSNQNFKECVHFRNNTASKIYNSILMGYPRGILVEGSSTLANCAASSFLKSDYVQQATGNYRSYIPAFDPNVDSANVALITHGNIYSTTYAGVLINANFPISNPDNLIPAVGNPLPFCDTFLYTGGFWTSVNYVGAFDPDGDNWAGDWTNFNPQNTNYDGKLDYTPKVTSTTTDAICPASGSIDISITNGISPYSYSWSNGANTQDLTGLSKASYTVTVTNAGGFCSTSKTIKIKNVKPELTSCVNQTSSSVKIKWSADLQGSVTGYELRKKKHSVSSWDPWVNVGNVLSVKVTGLVSDKKYDFQLRGICTSGNTVKSSTLTCSTTERLANDNTTVETLSIYPNPSSGIFEIRLNEFSTEPVININITDILGKIVYTGTIGAEKHLSINLSGLSSGTYNVRIYDGNNILSRNFIIAK